jgi:hypothetical protein
MIVIIVLSRFECVHVFNQLQACKPPVQHDDHPTLFYRGDDPIDLIPDLEQERCIPALQLASSSHIIILSGTHQQIGIGAIERPCWSWWVQVGTVLQLRASQPLNNHMFFFSFLRCYIHRTSIRGLRGVCSFSLSWGQLVD